MTIFPDAHSASINTNRDDFDFQSLFPSLQYFLCIPLCKIKFKSGQGRQHFFQKRFLSSGSGASRSPLDGLSVCLSVRLSVCQKKRFRDCLGLYECKGRL